ncbi:MAG: glycosyltransferase [Roseateles asaccharophilus]|uniref:glycosyltransferase n=1 Tax=Roseateles asaccharophilus TaxID=582607 RepID=UPI00391A190C
MSGASVLKILFLMYDALPPFRPDVKALFGQELPKLGVCSDLLGQTSPDYSPSARWGGGELLPMGRQRKGLLGEFIRPFRDLVGLLRHLKPEHRVIQVRDKIRTGVLAWIVARLTGRKIVYWMSFPFADGFEARARELGRSKGWVVWLANWSRATLARWVFYRFLVHRVDHLFVQSDAMLQMMQRRTGLAAQRMTAVPMGVAASWLSRDRQALAGERPTVLEGRRVLAYMGTLARSRQPEFLLRVLERIRESEPSALLLLIGDAPSADEQAWLREQIASSPAANAVHLTGWLAPEEGQRWLAHAELGYSPIPRGPLFDVGSPTKAMEYMALGIPCVANDNPDQRLALEQSGAGLCVPMEVEAFAQASLRILRDPELAQRLSECGPTWIAQHRSYPVLAAKVAAAYRTLLEPSHVA